MVSTQDLPVDYSGFIAVICAVAGVMFNFRIHFHVGRRRIPTTSVAHLHRDSPLLRLTLPSTATLFLHPSLFDFLETNVMSEPWRISLFQVKASSSEESSPPVDAREIFSDLKEKWDALENKSTVILYGGGAIVAVWLSSIVVGAINSVPLLPKIMELEGLGYTGWGLDFALRRCVEIASDESLVGNVSDLLGNGLFLRNCILDSGKVILNRT
ncbi:hypothetical protein Vadar_005304 [Vaccinium darrowii]|uniref:Uncharacterized protein n=1 Tax=Vaccinium darrowii TaxID=229202 RepID=A0ACB7XG11_9ERIC|nr:hypothetical protein Vadar_005304 [Vaccinium darrowii]